MKIRLSHIFDEIISIENLLEAWMEFIRGKRNKIDVRQFQSNLMDNILTLHNDLTNYTYKHDGYQAFNINDPKPGNIHKATVRDRLVHHAIYRILYPLFNKTFITDSFSCRFEKGTHKSIERFLRYYRKVSKNNTKTCYVLKCDIKKFFDSVDQKILYNILKEKIADKDAMLLLGEVITSFNKNSVQLELFDLQNANRERERERESSALRARNSHWKFNQPNIRQYLLERI